MKVEFFKEKKHLAIAISFLLLIFIGILSIRMGSVDYNFSDIFRILFNSEMTSDKNVLMNIRLPRILIAAIVGANLSIAGALLQAVMQNPLADPGLTGVSSGASLMAIIIMLLFPQYSYLVPFVSFLGGALACGLVYGLAWKNGIKPMRIILAGVAVNAILGGGTSLLSTLNSDKIQGVLLWVNGSISGKTWGDVRVLAIYSAVGLFFAMLCIRKANILQLGDEMSTNLGVDINKYRIIISLVAVFLAGISTAIVGIIGFVGLIVPHIARLLIGSDYKYVLPLSVTLGSSLLLLGDTFARTVVNPIELPVGVIMAVIGGPFFLYLLRRGQA
ncbi:fecCD transport family protein [Clostridium argentinense CDC 2741]|uniref:FecCD transport family protein n=1 Tax=Clostridium argentinense CDC 2741 TaxID=1418104 RepID=A0A0C1U9Q4_9CLOT|nr:iron ABC transporter permease [Clostridium argentinense]ARC83866.1 iron ABC transporter permease [Clostridium argentinense]KIE44340.1 fecCD transport family protein [Clostridium argentinense CDC 2741]NFF39774.1 iron ABC transporter permease [Clostridium argentinense]NFP49774.1 iron ABC transporter permease [Clostridium argentinense]NFP72175.1 iron ABC transporter permease [Clostridium argentinense]